MRSAAKWLRRPLAHDRISAVMGLLLSIALGLVVWIVLWAIGKSGFDAGLIGLAIILIGASLRIITRYLPGRRS